ncbi:MAG: hypothetical protein CMP59_11800 [Flavobacteriales bacterium]|nr:hypothetical protein [Flavobacteriales bacterium]|tara:strand:+ start:163 stop:630 length:468 start_codon:yes stop_codon:yes gene_type:complete
MNEFLFARILHVLAVVVWIGGVSMVTTVIIPSIKKMQKKETQLNSFEQIEGKFASIAKIATILTALSGFYMLYVLDAWHRYLDLSFWWLHAMTIIWLIFTLILFVLEPFLLRGLFKRFIQENQEKSLRIMQRAHWVLLLLSLITIAAGVAGSHGW